MESCEVKGANGAKGTFEELSAEMRENRYWYRFFARPCCPAPDAENANKMLDHLKADVDASDFTGEQKDELKALIEERKAWYPTSGLCRA